jgi:hypothetical protein
MVDYFKRLSSAVSDYIGGVIESFSVNHTILEFGDAVRGWRKTDTQHMTLDDALEELSSLDVRNTITGHFGRFGDKTIENLMPADVIEHITTDIKPDTAKRGRYVNIEFMNYVKSAGSKSRLVISGGPVYVILGDKALKEPIDLLEVYDFYPAIRLPSQY